MAPTAAAGLSCQHAAKLTRVLAPALGAQPPLGAAVWAPQWVRARGQAPGQRADPPEQTRPCIRRNQHATVMNREASRRRHRGCGDRHLPGSRPTAAPRAVSGWERMGGSPQLPCSPGQQVPLGCNGRGGRQEQQQCCQGGGCLACGPHARPADRAGSNQGSAPPQYTNPASCRRQRRRRQGLAIQGRQIP